MNDAEYLFKTDAAEKKRNGRGIYNKKGGSKSKKCTLPGDYLTPAQKKKLSKTIVDVNLREPMTIEQFKALSSEIQVEYLTFIRDRFGVGLRTISSELFGMSPQYLSNNMIQKGCSHLKGIFPKKPMKQSKEQIRNWDLWLGKDYVEPPELKEVREKAKVYQLEKTDKFHTYKPKSIIEEPKEDIPDFNPIILEDIPIQPIPKMEKVAREGEIDVVDIKIKDDPPESEDQHKRHGRFPWGEDLDASSLSMTFDKTCSYEDICGKLKFVLMANANGRNVSHFEFTVKFESKGGDSNEEVSVNPK